MSGQSILESAKKTLEDAAAANKSLLDNLKRTPAAGQPTPHDVFGAPWARRGEDIMSSRGFSFLKMLGLITGAVEPDNAKIEVDVHNRLHDVYHKALGGAGYAYAGAGRDGVNRFMAPLGTAYMMSDMVPADFRAEMKSLVHAGVHGFDPAGIGYLAKSLPDGPGGWQRKAMSWLNETSGGSLVAPAEQGELIELLRNKEALVNAGARTVPLPPQGRLKYPRQTAASTTYWVGENKPITESTPGTGEVTLSAKKLAVRITAPNELIRFASPAAEALLRDDMTKSLALGLDLAGLEGAGSDTTPRGILNHPNINRVTSSSTGANGDKLVGQDFYRMMAAVEESNAELEAFIMRPKTWYKILQLRSDAVSQGDAAGPFLFNLIREAGAGSAEQLGGYKVVKSTQVSQARTKGNATNLTYLLGGMFSDVLIGMFGAIEFAQTTQSDSAFINDQTLVRGILSADIAVRHEAAFALLDNIDTTL